VLLGKAEPGGRLPTTWAARQQDVPILSTRPIEGALDYAEGLHIGYRAWLRAGVPHAYPFGHGLGYTTRAYERIDGPASVTAGEDMTIQVQVRNTGTRAGRQVVQVYLSRPASLVDRPAVWLGGYGVFNVAAGQRVTAPILVGARSLRTEPGTFRVTAWPSAADQQLSFDVEVKQAES
jgi:beta-glucosidase